MARKLQIPGNEASVATRSAKSAELKVETREDLPFDIQLQKVVDVFSARDAGEQITVPLEPPPTQEEAPATGQIAEVELEDGVKLWMRIGSLYRDFGAPRSRGATPSPDDEVWKIAPAMVKPANASRGARDAGRETAVRRVTIYKWSAKPASAPIAPAAESDRSRGALKDLAQGGLIDGVADFAFEFVADRVADKVGRQVEKHQHGKYPLGLYQLNLTGKLEPRQITGFDAKDATQPLLLFIHGTMSSFAGSFGGLWTTEAGADARKDLAGRYQHAYALQHYTLTESPIDNALAVAQALPPGARLHLVTHSRGGLVGDLLCLGQQVLDEQLPDAVEDPFQSDDKILDAEYKRQKKNLDALIALLIDKKIVVERYVRVACPSRGTTLASGRLDRWLSIFKLLGDLVPAIKLPLKFLLALIAEHKDPTTLPGLEAQMPGSPLIRRLNLPQISVRADLSVISGDTEGTGLLGRIKEFALDRFYEDETDLIVNTGAMYGGLARVDGGRFHLDRGVAVNHFNYFDNAETVHKLAEGVLRLDGSDAGFLPLSEAKQKEPVARAVLRRAAQGPRPAVFVLPGIMGSHLSVDDKRIWMHIGRLMLGGLGKLKMNGAVVEANPFLEDYYSDLALHLAQTHEALPFPYDWRRSTLQAGDLLAKEITKKLDMLEPSGHPVRIVAHSMGGLVVRAMIAQHGDVWRRMTTHPGSRLIMLGTPNGGSHEILRLLTGRATTLHQLALLDLGRSARGLLKIISGFPGVLELLPIVNDFECFKPEFWKQLEQSDQDTRYQWAPPETSRLQAAQRARQAIESVKLDADKTLYVAGTAPATPIGWRMETEFDYDGGRGHWQTIVFEATAQGDGQVPWATGIPVGVKRWYLDDVVHGDLPSHQPAFPAYVELLETGNTALLPNAPPAVRGTAATRVFDMPIELPPNLPDSRDLAASALGSRPPRKARAKKYVLPKARITVTHGDLVYARHPVAVGHYHGDTIVSAEAYLDRVLGERLRKRNRLDLYPGELGTHEIFFNADPRGKPGGAIVIGLGQVGELAPGRLTSAFARAALTYALRVEECPDERFGGASGAPRHARITTLLIGTGAGGMTVRDSIEAILRGVGSANRRLHEIGVSDKVWIDEVEFIELWQDIAISAARELERALMDGELSGLFDWPARCIGDGQGGRRRAMFEEAGNWWHRLEIVYDKKRDELRFIALTDRARAEETLVAGQRRLADDFIRSAIKETNYQRDISRTLFEMLVPNRLKQMAPNQEDLVLIVDEVSGGYPWELLEDRWSTGGKPLAVTTGMLRQLKTAVFRERPATPVLDMAYVVGNPVLPAWREDFPFTELPGAESEAVAVADFLHTHGFTVKRQIHSRAGAILADLHAEGYRILHLAGHGEHEFEIADNAGDSTRDSCATCEQPLPKIKKPVSGMIIGDGMLLTPGDIEQMRWTPEIVFINCCHLGRLESGALSLSSATNRYSQFAANIAAQFIRMGVRAVIAAGWAVDDTAAETFALSFYSHLLDDDRFGDAVRAARGETFDRHGNTNTWGAYQCYGDPSYRLRLRPGPQSQRKPRNYVSPAQVVIDLENFASQARTTGSEVGELEKIEQAVTQVRGDWLKRHDVAAALGIAYGELGEFEKAITHLNQALKAEKAEFSVRAIEQRANFTTRLAVESARKVRSATARRQLMDGIDEAIEDLDKLAGWGETAERLSLLGSAYKRKAQIAQPSPRSGAEARAAVVNERKEALAKMAEYYSRAHRKICGNDCQDDAGQDSDGNALQAADKNAGKKQRAPAKATKQDCKKLDAYPLLNWLTAEVLLSWYGKPDQQALAQLAGWCQKAEAFADEQEEQDPHFWNSIVKPNCDLLRALVAKQVAKDKHALIAAYQKTGSRGASQREFGSVLDHFEFLAEIAEGAGGGLDEEAKALREIKERLSGPGGPR